MKNISIIELESVESTSTYALNKASENYPEGTIIWAHHQTAGRGQRQDKTWISPPGNLYASLILRPQCLIEDVPQLGFVTSYALADALVKIGINPDLIKVKWPNDILIDQKKVGGVLIETVLDEQYALKGVVVGVGLNIAHHPSDTRFPATHINRYLRSPISVREVLEIVIENIFCFYEQWQKEGFQKIRQEWLHYAAFLHHGIRTAQGLKGLFKGIDEKGYLLLEQNTGEIVRLTSGSVDLVPCDIIDDRQSS